MTKEIKNGLYVDEDGTKYWYLNDKLHREEGPAKEYASGTKIWYLNDKLHREDGPAEEWADGTKEWFLNGERHREDGPACEWADGDKWWYLNGALHREDGPAVERGNGQKEWWLYYEPLSTAQIKILKAIPTMPLDSLLKIQDDLFKDMIARRLKEG